MASLRPIPGHDWQVDASSREVIRAGRRVRLAEKPFLVLVALIDAQGEVVTRAALQKRLWSDDTFVDFDNNLNSAIATLRHVLDCRASAPRCIETIPKVGYRLIVRQQDAHAPPPSPASEPYEAARPRFAPRAFAGAAIVTCALAATLTALVWPRPMVPAGSSRTASREAQALFDRGIYLRGRYFAAAHDPSRLADARAAFAEALRLDPGFTAAAAEQAETLIEMSFAGTVRFRDGLEAAREAAARARDLDPDSPIAARVTGLTTLFLDWDFAGARAWLDRAAARLPDAKTSLAQATWLAAAGRFDEAVAAAERAVALDPAAFYVRADLAMFYLAASRNAEAAASARRVLEAAPEFAGAHAYALLASERLGEWPDAARHARALMRASGAGAHEIARVDRAEPGEAVRLWREWDLARLEGEAAGRRGDFALQIALRRAALGDREAAVRELREALARRHALLVFVRSFPELAPLRGDPSFEQIARAVNPA